MLEFIRKHKLVTLFAVGALIRVILLFVDYSWDVNSFMTWGKDAFTRGFAGFYEKRSSMTFASAYPNYPPIAVYLFYLAHGAYSLIFDLAWKLHLLHLFPGKLIIILQNRVVQASFFKLPAVLADFGIVKLLILIYKKLFKEKKRSKHILILSSVILLNPAFFYTSALWGQIDSIGLFFILLAFYSLLFTKKYLWAGLWFTAALLTKQSVIIFAPLFVLIFLTKQPFPKILKTTSICLFIFFLFFLPFYSKGNIFLMPFITYISNILFVSGLPFVSNHAFNFWVFLTHWKDILASSAFMFSSYQFWGYALWSIFTAPILYRVMKDKGEPRSVLFAAGLSAFSAFLFLTKMHERHFQQVLPFLFIFLLRDKKLFVASIFLSLFHFLNLYHNWAVPHIDPLLRVISNLGLIYALIIGALVVFFSIYVNYLRGVYKDV